MTNFGVVQFIFSLVELVVTTVWIWLPLAGVLGYLAWQNWRRTKFALKTDYQLLILEIPRNNEKRELSAEQLFASLHGILRPRKEILREGAIQEHISFEIVTIGQQIKFYVWTPKHLQSFVEGQIYAQYPDVQISEAVDDYSNREFNQTVAHSAELSMIASDTLPIRTFPNFEVDPLAAITATLSKLDSAHEELWVQILARPLNDSWHTKGAKEIINIKRGKSRGVGAGVLGYFLQIFSALFKPPEATGSTSSGVDLTERERSQISAIEEKSNKLGYEVKIRIVYLGDNESTAKIRMQSLVGTFKQFNSTNLNGFKQRKSSFDASVVREYRARYFAGKGFTLNTEELASIWHLPHTNVETPNIVWTKTNVAEPPSQLPTLTNASEEELSLFGVTNFRGSNLQFGLRRKDRARHLYIIGQTGTGKSGLLNLLTLSDIYHHEGFALVDPHGDYAQNMLRYIPQERAKQVVYFNPADTEHPLAFNPMEVTDPKLKGHISSELVGVLKRMFDSWGPRLEYILRYTILALLDYPNSTMLDITRMLTNKGFRDEVIDHITDPVVRSFWVAEFNSWEPRFQTEAVAPILNKVGAFVANPMVRNIVGQPQSSFNIRQVMDQGGILIVNLSRGLVGEDNAAILGALMVTKIQLAAMSRADMPEDQRRPFYLYVDEFQNFATDSFSVILSEARKYGLKLTVANQYINQMIPEVRDAIFGNVGSIVAFRVGAEDGRILEKYFEPYFTANDLVNTTNRYFTAALSIDGEKSKAFSASTLNIPPTEQDLSPVIIENSRQVFGSPRQIVEQYIQKQALERDSKQKANTRVRRENRKERGRNNQRTNRQPQPKPNQSRPRPQQAQQAHAQQNNDGSLNENEVITLR
ncbi:TPA: DUF87 domain-containing protein [Candidatus Saccharibacteria bacterium]|nr:DUF87 domain-containing protein [Candidatus Saccharibacteria bacterium]HIO87584.1 DUF87 domain-containing protein [Candidatus Saccharibacteria bacterium]